MPGRRARPDRLPAYRLYKPKNLGVVRLDGRDYYLGRHGTAESRERYRRLIADWLAGRPLRKPSAEADPAALTVAELILGYVGFATGYYVRDGEPTSELRNVRLALRPLRAQFGSTPAAEFGPLRLKRLREEYVASGLSRGEVNKRVRHVIRAFRWAASEELVPVTTFQALRTVAGLRKGRTAAPDRPKVRPVDDAVVEAVLPHLNATVAAMARLQRLTAMRAGELAILRTGDLDRSGPVWTYEPGRHKTEHHDKTRTVFLGPKAQAVLTPFLKADPERPVFSPREAAERNYAERRAARATPMTPSQRARRRTPGRRRRPGEVYAVTSYAHAIARGCDRAFPHPTLAAVKRKDLTAEQRAALRTWRRAHRFHPHQLRHSAATEVRARFGLEAAQLILGHARADVTQVYAERDEARARQIAREVG